MNKKKKTIFWIAWAMFIILCWVPALKKYKILGAEMITNELSAGVTAHYFENLNSIDVESEDTEFSTSCGDVFVEDYTEKDVPENNGFKSYMDAKCITSKSSPQYQLKSSYLLADNGIYTVNGRYCVAVGSYYTTEIGTLIDLIMDNGSIVPCILADCKSDTHTDIETHRQNVNGSIVEFIVSTSDLDSIAKKMGDCSYADERLLGEIIAIRIFK